MTTPKFMPKKPLFEKYYGAGLNVVCESDFNKWRGDG